MRALYTITNSTGQVRYAGNGVTTAFPVTFQFFEADTIRVQAVVDETATLRVLNVDYTVSGGAGETGTVTFATAPPTGTTVVIDLDIPFLQETIDLAPNGPLPAEDVEQGFDRVVTMVKQLNARQGSTPRLSAAYDPDDGEITLPVPVSGQILVGNASGTGWDGGSVSDLGDALPVVVTGATDGDTLVYDAGAGAWRNLPGTRTIEEYGGVADNAGATAANDAAFAAFAADAAAHALFLRPGADYYVSSTVDVPVGKGLDGRLFLPGNPTAGTRIIGTPTLTPVLRVGTSSSNGTASVSNLTVTRLGTPTAEVGISVVDGYNVQFQNVLSDNSYRNWLFTAHPAIGAGLSIRLQNCYSARCNGSHCTIDGFPEVYWVGGRFGQNGAGDYAGVAYVQTIGGVTGTAGGPNTVKFIGVQFNQGSNPPLYFHLFSNLTGPYPGVAATIFLYSQCHVEGVTGALFISDASWNVIDNLTIHQCVFNCPSTPAFALAPETQIANWGFFDTLFFVSTFTLDPNSQINGLTIVGGYIGNAGAGGPTTIDAGAGGGAALSIIGTTFAGNLTITGAFAEKTLLPGGFNSGVMADSGTGNGFMMPRNRRFTGTADGSGNLSLAHGIGSLSLLALSVSAAYKTAGTAWAPMTVNFVDGSNISVSGGGGAASRPVVIYVEYARATHSGW